MKSSKAGWSAVAVIVLMVMTWTVETRASQLRDELTELCDEDRAVCLDLFRGLIGDGVLDQDRDGVSDLADRCPGTPTAIALAQRILLDQESALTATGNIIVESRRQLIYAVNGTFAQTERDVFADRIALRFNLLFDVANSRSDGRYLFGGLRDREPPFEMIGGFGPDSVPTVRYLGDQSVLKLPIGRQGERQPITIPGSLVFLGELDGDIRFRDQAPIDLFALLSDTYLELRNDDRGGLIDSLLLTNRVFDNLGYLLLETEEQFELTTLFVVTTATSGVDSDGCTQEQFCSGIRIERRKNGRICERSDFRNDEPLRRHPKDCRLVEAEDRELRCSARSPERDRDDRRKRKGGRKH